MLRSPNMSGTLPAVSFENIPVTPSPLTATTIPATTVDLSAEAFRISADVDIHFSVGKDVIANANCPVLFAGCSEIINCRLGEKVSVIKKSGQPDGQAWIHQVKGQN